MIIGTIEMYNSAKDHAGGLSPYILVE